MKIKVQRIGEDKGDVRELAGVPAKGDVLSLPNADRTVLAVDWNVGAKSEDVAATVWVR